MGKRTIDTHFFALCVVRLGHRFRIVSGHRRLRPQIVLFALVVIHAFFYGALVRTESPFTRLLVLAAVLVIVAQTVGIWLWRHSKELRTPEARKEFFGMCRASGVAGVKIDFSRVECRFTEVAVEAYGEG
mgnify:CR=1 FL=1